MPIYEYQCTACDTVFPRLQRLGASTDGVTCPKCESEQVEKVVSAFSSSGGGETSAGAGAPGCGGGFT